MRLTVATYRLLVLQPTRVAYLGCKLGFQAQLAPSFLLFWSHSGPCSGDDVTSTVDTLSGPHAFEVVLIYLNLAMS